MSKQSAVQANHGGAPGFTRSRSGLLERRNTSSPHLCVQREGAGPAVHSSTPSLVRYVVESPGRPLDAATRSFMEPRFGHDFSRVRIHTDQTAALSARAVDANAFTAGNHIVFASGRYAPGTPGGQGLIAHELTHVVQQASGPVAGTPVGSGLRVSQPADAFELRAASVERLLATGHPTLTAFLNGASPIDPQSQSPSQDLYLQRQGEGPFTQAGAIFGGLGALFALGQLGVALAPPTAAPLTGGFSVQNQVQLGQLNAPTQPKTEGEPKAPPIGTEGFDYPKRKTIMHVSASKDSSADIALFLRYDGHNILEAYTQEENVRGYAGGSRDDNASVNFRAAQSGGTDSTIADATILCEGINVQGHTFKGNKIQRFRGRLRARGNGEVTADDARLTAGQGFAKTAKSEPYISIGFEEPAPGLPRPAPPEKPPKGDFPAPEGFPEKRFA